MSKAYTNIDTDLLLRFLRDADAEIPRLEKRLRQKDREYQAVAKLRDALSTSRASMVRELQRRKVLPTEEATPEVVPPPPAV